jgi:thiol:disulfide interchange protein DsbD
LLGLFRTDHDLQGIKVGPSRMLLGGLFLFLALFMAPALFGQAPKNRLWSVVSAMLPPDGSELFSPPAGLAKAGGGMRIAAVSTDPEKAVREQKNFHGVEWGLSYEAAVEEAKATGKPILIDFTGENCQNCRYMERDVFVKPEVIAELNKFTRVQLYTDFVKIKTIDPAVQRKLGDQNLDRQLKYGEASNPLYVILAPDETLLGSKGGYIKPELFVEFLGKGLAKNKSGVKTVGDAPAAAKPGS